VAAVPCNSYTSVRAGRHHRESLEASLADSLVTDNPELFLALLAEVANPSFSLWIGLCDLRNAEHLLYFSCQPLRVNLVVTQQANDDDPMSNCCHESRALPRSRHRLYLMVGTKSLVKVPLEQGGVPRRSTDSHCSLEVSDIASCTPFRHVGPFWSGP